MTKEQALENWRKVCNKAYLEDSIPFREDPAYWEFFAIEHRN